MTPVAPADRISHILNHCRTIAVVGLSHKPHRPSFDVARYMQAAGYRIIPINPNEVEVLGEKAYASLTEAIALGGSIESIWMQLGITHPEAAAKAEAANLMVVQDRCLKIDHRVLRFTGIVRRID